MAGELEFDGRDCPYHDGPETLAEILKGTPLTLNGKNQWYAKMPFRDDILSLIFKPDLQSCNSVLSYTKGSARDVSALQIYEGLESINYLRRELIPLLNRDSKSNLNKQ